LIVGCVQREAVAHFFGFQSAPLKSRSSQGAADAADHTALVVDFAARGST
jgi:hypothetical protein